MARPIVYKCPQTGMNVQHWLSDSPNDAQKKTHETIVCPACSKLHFINNTSGKLLGQK
jgi:hypothetical protein